ncbi:MAG: TfuA-like protein [Rhizobiaceae bacterium]|nr:TfuA-like protein [Rhizobiaceae bacterium]
MAGDIIAFAGPSIAGIELDAFQQIEFRAPCRQGDIFLATRETPSVIAIIDGYFEGQPSVWHKEILHALHEGIHVLGASSMGALRAAEVHTFGMRGVGEVFKAYRDGVVEDDDEVALVHGPEELGYPALSEPMINVRATCSFAIEQDILSARDAELVCETAKSTFYKERTWDTIIQALDVSALEDFDLATFAHWLSENALDQKRIDALELLEILQHGEFSTRFVPEFEFVVTEFWQRCTAVWLSQNVSAQTMAENPDAGGYRLFD